MVMACKPSRNALFIWLLQVALGCFIVEAGFIVELFRGKGETSELKSQIKQPLLLEFRSNTLVQPAVGKLEQLSPSKGYLVDEMGQPLVPKLVGKENLEDIFEEVTRKYYNRVPASSKYPMEPTNLMVEIKEIDEEVKKNKFIRIKESHQRLDEILSQRLKEVTEKYREIMNLSNENIGYKKNKASARDKIQEALSYTQQEDMAEAERYKETPNELLKDKDTIQSATKYFLDQGIVRNDDISNTLEALGENFYDEAWFQKNITDRSRREEDFDPFFSSIEIKDYIINHPSIKQHRVILKALNHENLRSSILKFLLSYSELIFYHYSDQMSNSARSSINKILNDLIEGKSLSNHVWESSFTGAFSDVAHYNSRMIYHLILYHAYSFNKPEAGSNMISIAQRMQDFKNVLRIQQRILNFYRSKRFMGYELKITTHYKNYMDEIIKVRLKNNGHKTIAVDNFNQLKIEVSKAGFQKSVLARNLVEWQRNVDSARSGVLMQLNKEKTDFNNLQTVKHIDNNLQWEKSEIIRLTKFYNKSYIWNADLSLELSISMWLREINDEISASKRPLSQRIYSGLFSD